MAYPVADSSQKTVGVHGPGRAPRSAREGLREHSPAARLGHHRDRRAEHRGGAQPRLGAIRWPIDRGSDRNAEAVAQHPADRHQDRRGRKWSASTAMPWSRAGRGWPASVSPCWKPRRATAPIDSRNSIIMLGSLLFILGLSLLVSNGWVAALQEVGRTAERVRQGRSVAEAAEGRGFAGTESAGPEHHRHDQSPARRAGSRRGAGVRRAARARGEGIAPAAADPAGAARRHRRARLRRRARAEQSASGDPRHRRSCSSVIRGLTVPRPSRKSPSSRRRAAVLARRSSATCRASAVSSPAPRPRS